MLKRAGKFHLALFYFIFYKILYKVNATLSLVMNPTNIHQKKRQNEEIENYYSFMFNN